MFQFNLPRKLVSTVQMWVSLFLIVLAFVFSLTPIITLKNGENIGEITEMIMDLDLGTDVEEIVGMIKEETPVSSPKMIGSISLIVKIVGAATAKGDDRAEKAEKLEKYLDSKQGKQAIATAICLAVAITKTVDFEKSGDNPLSILLNTVFSLVGLIAMLLLTLALPFIFGFIALTSLVKTLSNMKKDPEHAAASLSKKLPGKISLPLLLMLFQCVVPGMTYAFGIVAICIVAIIATVVNFVASRAREYPSEQFKYLNVMQLPAIAGIIGFLVFFLNIIRTGIFKAFVGGNFIEYVEKAELAQRAKIKVDNGYVIAGILIVVYVAILMKCIAYLDRAARRLSCAVKREHKRGLIGLIFPAKLKDNDLFSAIVCLATFIIPTYIMGTKYPVPGSKETVKLLELSDKQQGFLNAALVGIIIMIVADLSVIVLKQVFCSKLKREDAEALMTGTAKSTEEIVAEAQQILANAEATAAAAATADTTSAE